MDDLDTALADLKTIAEEKKKFNISHVRAIKRKFKEVCDTTKRETQRIERERSCKKPAGSTRSGARRGVVKQAVYSDGKWINKGIDDASDKFDDSEKEFLKKAIDKFKAVHELKFEHLKYLVVDVFLSELKNIKEGKIKSQFHDRYKELKGKSKMDLFAEIRTSLFTNEQRDYINGLLQGAFDTTSKDDNDDIKHSDINYVEIVMLAESTIRIVKHVHKFDTNEDAFSFMIASSKETHGFGDD